MPVPNYRIRFRHFVACAMISTGLSVPALSLAHDFWLEPDRFFLDVEGSQAVSIFIGHPDEKIRWDLQPERLIAVRRVSSHEVRDQFQYYQSGDPALTMQVDAPGLHWVTVETQDSISELPADRFNDYVEKENLTAIEMDRIRKRKVEEAGIERYSRRAKTLVAVGDWEAGNDDHITRPLGLTLEIIPALNPLSAEAGSPLPFEVRYRGQPLSGALIKIIRLDQDEEMRKVVTGSDGRVIIPRPETGRWMYHVIWGSPLPDSYDQDYDTIFSSLTFSVDVPD